MVDAQAAPPEPTQEPAAEATPSQPAQEATVAQVGDWHLVTYGGWQVSVGPDGLLMLPRHLHPREWADFVAAGSMAAQVGAKVIAANEAKAKGDNRTLPKASVIVTEGPPPPGAARMPITAGPNQPARPQRDRATIGRTRNGRAGTAV